MRAVLVVFPGCAHGEVAPLLTLLEGAAAWEVAGPTRDPVRVREGFSIAVDARYAEVAGEIDLAVVPGGDIASVIEDAALAALLGRARAVAAICNGVLLAGLAGVARGRAVTHTAVPRWAPRPTFDALLVLADRALAGARYVDEDVVVDGALVTAKPWAAIDFAKKAAVVAGALSRDEAASRARYQRGFRDRTWGEPYRRWALLLTQIEGVPTSRADVEAHVAHLRVLEREGRLEIAGPFPEHASGLVVLRATSRDEAERIAAADPFVTRGVRRVEVRPWLISCDDDDHLLGGAVSEG